MKEKELEAFMEIYKKEGSKFGINTDILELIYRQAYQVAYWDNMFHNEKGHKEI